MKKLIVPAILTDKKDELIAMVNSCSSFCDYIQIDVMDGQFVASKSILLDDLRGLNFSIKSEAHLMVNEPLKWLEVFQQLGSNKIIYHFEIKDNHPAIIDSIKKQNLKVGLAINPSTQISDFKFLIEKVDSILFLSVIPGFYGSEFIPDVLNKIKEFKKLYPNKYTGIDGGVKLNNVRDVAASGVDYICIGSAILKSKNPEETYLKIKALLNE